MLINMSVLSYVEIFAAVVQQGSFTAAAETLNTSKPVVSKHVTQLEKYLGVQLLHRTTRRLHLTEAGEVFARYAENIVAISQEAEQSVLPLQHEASGKLRITAPESLAISLLPNALAGFQQKFSGIEVDLHISGDFVDLIEEGFDVGLRMGSLDDSSLIARRLMPCRFHICAAPDYWKKHGKPIHPNDLKSHNCLIYSQSRRADTWSFQDEKTGEKIQVKVQGNLKSDTGHIILDAGLKGQGVFIAPCYMVESALTDGRLEQVLTAFALSSAGLFVIYPQSKMVPRKVRVFIDYMKESLNPD